MKAVVMETRGRKAAVLLKDGTFRIAHGQYQVGETIDYRDETPSLRRWLAAAAAVVVGLGIGGGFWYDANYVAYAEISLDVNPSIVYTVNKRSRVLEVRAVNDEAAEAVGMLEAEGIRFMPVSNAIDRTMTIFEEEGYLDAENEDYVLMNISADNAGIQERVASEIETGMERAMGRDASMEYRVDYSDRATAKRAADSDMSTGRYAVWEQEGGDRKPEEYADMPVRELMGKPEEAAPVAPEESGATQAEKDVLTVPAEGVREQGAPDIPNQQPLEMPQSRDNSNSSNEPDATFGEPEQGRDVGTTEDRQDQQFAASEGKSGESLKIGSQPPDETQTETDARPSQEEGSKAMQQNGGKQDLSSPPDRDMKGNDMSQGSPGNAPGGLGNQPPK